MGYFGRLMFTFIMLMCMFSYIIYKSDTLVTTNRKDVYKAAIKSASLVATSQLIDTNNINLLYDGTKREVNDFNINFDTLKVFRDNLSQNLGSKKDGDLIGIKNINIPLAGYITYRYILGITYDDKYLMPYGYTRYMTSTTLNTNIRNTTWEFTLGDIVIIKGVRHEIRGDNQLYNLDTGTNYILDSLLTETQLTSLNQYKWMVIMDSIEKYLNDHSGVQFNAIAQSTQMENRFTFGKRYDSEVNTIIEGAGLFAVIDTYTGDISGTELFERTVTFGGSELINIAQPVKKL